MRRLSLYATKLKEATRAVKGRRRRHVSNGAAQFGHSLKVFENHSVFQISQVAG